MRVLEALQKVIRSDWTEFDKLPEEVQETILKSSKGEGLHCVNPDRGISLGIVNEGNLHSLSKESASNPDGNKGFKKCNFKKKIMKILAQKVQD